jgi:hypothetical protein
MANPRAQERLEGADIRIYPVNAGTVRKGFPVKRVGANVIEGVAIGDNTIGIALDAGDVAGVAGATSIRVVHYGKGIVQGLVGTGAATPGSFAKWAGAGDGLTDATVGGATTKLVVHGQWVESGAAGEYAGLNLGMASATVGS